MDNKMTNRQILGEAMLWALENDRPVMVFGVRHMEAVDKTVMDLGRELLSVESIAPVTSSVPSGRSYRLHGKGTRQWLYLVPGAEGSVSDIFYGKCWSLSWGEDHPPAPRRGPEPEWKGLAHGQMIGAEPIPPKRTVPTVGDHVRVLRNEPGEFIVPKVGDVLVVSHVTYSGVSVYVPESNEDDRYFLRDGNFEIVEDDVSVDEKVGAAVRDEFAAANVESIKGVAPTGLMTPTLPNPAWGSGPVDNPVVETVPEVKYNHPVLGEVDIASDELSKLRLDVDHAYQQWMDALHKFVQASGRG